MVLLDIMSTVKDIGAILMLLLPIILLVVGWMARKGWISKEQREEVETLFKVVAGGVDGFKSLHKEEARDLTAIIKAKAQGAKVSEKLDSYLERFNLNQPKSK